MKKIVLLLAIVGLCASCASRLISEMRNKFLTLVTEDNFKQITTDSKRYEVQTFVLDNTYDLYIRQICRKKFDGDFYDSGNPKNVAAVTRCNCEEMPTGQTPERMEIQYVFYSKTHQRFIFISTIPPYIDHTKGTRVNTYDMALYNQHINYANINYFNHFLFGTVKGSNVTFKPTSDDSPDEYTLGFSPDGKVLTYESVYIKNNKRPRSNPSTTFAFPVKFYKQVTWDIGKDGNPAGNFDSPDNHPLVNKTIYLVYDKKYDEHFVLFHFNDVLYTNTSNSIQYNSLYFEEDRIKTY